MVRYRKKAHGQKQRLLGNREGSWRYAWQVVVDPGTDNNSAEREGGKYTWFTDKWSLFVNEVAPVGAAIITFDFTPVPRGNRLKIRFVGYYTGNHASPQAPRLEIYDYNLTSWVALSGGALTIGNDADEIIEVEAAGDGDWWEHATDPSNVRIRIFHPAVAGNTSHEFHINELSLAQMQVSTTTTTTTTTTSTTTTV
jgi:hypothetical protein